MTPTTITRADELAKAAEALLHSGSTESRRAALRHALNDYTAYRAARSTDGACDDTARLDWLENRHKCYWVTVQSQPAGHRVYEGEGCGLRAAIDAARAASGTGEAG